MQRGVDARSIEQRCAKLENRWNGGTEGLELWKEVLHSAYINCGQEWSCGNEYLQGEAASAQLVLQLCDHQVPVMQNCPC